MERGKLGTIVSIKNLDKKNLHLSKPWPFESMDPRALSLLLIFVFVSYVQNKSKPCKVGPEYTIELLLNGWHFSMFKFPRLL